MGGIFEFVKRKWWNLHIVSLSHPWTEFATRLWPGDPTQLENSFLEPTACIFGWFGLLTRNVGGCSGSNEEQRQSKMYDQDHTGKMEKSPSSSVLCSMWLFDKPRRGLHKSLVDHHATTVSVQGIIETDRRIIEVYPWNESSYHASSHTKKYDQAEKNPSVVNISHVATTEKWRPIACHGTKSTQTHGKEASQDPTGSWTHHCRQAVEFIKLHDHLDSVTGKYSQSPRIPSHVQMQNRKQVALFWKLVWTMEGIL